MKITILHRQPSLLRAIGLLLLLVAVCGGRAEAEPARGATTKADAKPARKPRIEPVLPFGFELGKTTLEMAEARWQEDGVQIVAKGNAGLGAGSGADGRASLSAPKIFLVDVADTEFDITRNGRFVFYEGVLYSLQFTLRSLIATGKERDNQLSQAEVEALDTQLRDKYGPPTSALRDIFAGKKPNLMIWEYGPNQLVLYKEGLRGSLFSYTNKPLLKQAERHKTVECNKVVACSGYKK